MNEDEAVRAKRQGETMLKEGNLEKALKLFTISQRITPNDSTDQLIREVKARMNGETLNRNDSSDELRDDMRFVSLVKNAVKSLWKIYESYERKYIALDYKIWIRSIIVIVSLLICLKFCFGYKLNIGSLPGDINFTNKNFSFHAPIVTSLLLSFFLNAILKVFNNS
jgi:hypothetical protein